ncbi:ethylene-overproduction protein 1-like protein [Tanacetum coccineum]
MNNLGSIYVDCGKHDLAADCYINALDIKHTRAHQGLARVYCLKDDRKAAYDEMTKLIENAENCASAYEKRSEYCDRDNATSDLCMATQLDPLRTYPYRYRAAGVCLDFLCQCSLTRAPGFLRPALTAMAADHAKASDFTRTLTFARKVI